MIDNTSKQSLVLLRNWPSQNESRYREFRPSLTRDNLTRNPYCTSITAREIYAIGHLVLPQDQSAERCSDINERSISMVSWKVYDPWWISCPRAAHKNDTWSRSPAEDGTIQVLVVSCWESDVSPQLCDIACLECKMFRPPVTVIQKETPDARKRQKKMLMRVGFEPTPFRTSGCNMLEGKYLKLAP